MVRVSGVSPDASDGEVRTCNAASGLVAPLLGPTNQTGLFVVRRTS
jgi:hypothetical protein